MKLINQYSNILNARVPEFNFSNPTIDPKELEKDLLEFMYKNKGIGLAANQVGLQHRVFVMGHWDSPDLGQAFFNPIILSVSDTYNDFEEGCLSFPGIFVKVKRPKSIQAQWQDSEGNPVQGEFTGYDCKCFLHEYDHLEGITFKHRVSNLKWNLAVKKGKK